MENVGIIGILAYPKREIKLYSRFQYYIAFFAIFESKYRFVKKNYKT